MPRPRPASATRPAGRPARNMRQVIAGMLMQTFMGVINLGKGLFNMVSGWFSPKPTRTTTPAATPTAPAPSTTAAGPTIPAAVPTPTPAAPRPATAADPTSSTPIFTRESFMRAAKWPLYGAAMYFAANNLFSNLFNAEPETPAPARTDYSHIPCVD